MSILEYLASKPYKEVAGLIAQIQQLKVAEVKPDGISVE